MHQAEAGLEAVRRPSNVSVDRTTDLVWPATHTARTWRSCPDSSSRRAACQALFLSTDGYSEPKEQPCPDCGSALTRSQQTAPAC